MDHFTSSIVSSLSSNYLQTLMINWPSICCVIILYYNPNTNNISIVRVIPPQCISSKLPENLLGFQENNVSASSYFVITNRLPRLLSHSHNSRQYFKSPINVNLQTTFKDIFRVHFTLWYWLSPCIFIYTLPSEPYWKSG